MQLVSERSALSLETQTSLHIPYVEADAAKRDKLLQPWLKRMFGWHLVQSVARTQATCYFVGPDLRRSLNFTGENTIKRIEPRHPLSLCHANYFSLALTLCLSQRASQLKKGVLSITDSASWSIAAPPNHLHSRTQQ